MKFSAALAALVLIPTLAHAHPGHGPSSFSHGFAHPLLGFDHLLAMVAVGLWAVQLGGRALWMAPASFLAAMLLGGALAVSGVGLPFVEQGILASVLVLGLLIAAAARLPLVAGVAIVGAFALFHGFGHAAEIPGTAAAAGYGAGFLAATAMLHVCGIAAGVMIRRMAEAQWIRAAGGAIAMAAVLLVFDLL